MQTSVIFITLVCISIFIDLFAHKKDKEISLLSASMWSLFWIFISLVFAYYLYITYDKDISSLFLTGYVLEKALSVDNLFVMMAIFTWFKVPINLRHRVLYYGILGAIIFRLIFVAIGTSLLSFGPIVEIIFGIIVGWSAFMMLKNKDEDEDEDYSNHLAYKLVYKYFPVFPKLIENNFFVSRNHDSVKNANKEFKKNLKKGYIVATPLFLCLCVIELSDVMFAFDSVPAVIVVSKEPLIIYSAMIFAILGLRMLYFVLEALKKYLIYLEKAVIVLLFFISFKIILNSTNEFLHHDLIINPVISLYIVLLILTIGILLSLIKNKK